MRMIQQSIRWIGLALMPVLILTAVFAVDDQQALQGRFTDLSWPDFYDSSGQAQMKSLLQGAEVFPQPEDRFLIKGLKIQTFSKNGDGEFVLDAKDCLYDTKHHSAESSGPLEMRTADGRFLTRGEGFLWKQSPSVLTISNHVHTVIHLTKVASTKP